VTEHRPCAVVEPPGLVIQDGVRKIEDFGGGWYGHWVRISSPEELDDELLGWLRESYHQMGMQERLARH